MIIKFFLPAIVIGSFTLFLLGCGNASNSDLGSVSGTIMLDGQPYPNAQVQFSPETGRPSIGITDDSGNYELTYLRNEKGALIGKHTVSITTISQSRSDRDPGPPPKEKIPTNYNIKTTLTVEVTEGENLHDFNLESK